MSREIDRSIEVEATPEEAFRSLVEPEELRAWLLDDAQSETRTGGRFRWVWSRAQGDVTDGVYLELDRPRRLVTHSADPSAPGPIVSSYSFEDVGGGRTRIRVVNSGFGSGTEWDEAFERWREGVVHFLQALRRRLEDGFDRRRMARLGVAFGPADEGRRIEAVVSGTPAERAGLQPGDVVTHLAGELVNDYDAIAQVLARRQPGEVIDVRLERGRTRRETQVQLLAPGSSARAAQAAR